LHNPLDAAGLAGHKRTENLLTYLVLLHVVGAAWLVWRFRALLSGGGEGGGGTTAGGGGGRPPPGPGRRGTRLRRVASNRSNDGGAGGGPAGVHATFSFADLTGVTTEGGGDGGGAVGGVRRAPSRGALGRRAV
jgi:hypothetical protein